MKCELCENKRIVSIKQGVIACIGDRGEFVISIDGRQSVIDVPYCLLCGKKIEKKED